MTKSEFEDLLIRYSKGECTNQENKKICTWFKRIKLKPHFALTAKEKSLLEMKMLLEIEKKIETNKKRLFKKRLFPGILNLYLIYGAIATILTMAALLSKNLNKRDVSIQSERPIESNKTLKMSFVYDETPLSTIVDELGNSYGMQVIMLSENMKSCSFSGDLSNMTLLQKFDTVCESVGANYQVHGSNIILSGHGCR